MIRISDKTECSGCHACKNICPKQCISMREDNEGFLYPFVDQDQCIHCSRCQTACPILNPLPLHYGQTNVDAFAAYTKNKDIRLNSSSGGIFTEIASYVIKHGGVVFGAVFDSSLQVVHTYTETEDGLDKFRGSKYVQSQIGDCYQQAKEFLTAGRLVLFTGTPCQIDGLLRFLNHSYDNLLTQDIICHGVPSPLSWRKYIEYREAVSSSKAQASSFRYKKYGWRNYSVQFKFADHTEYVQNLSRDLYMRSFLADICLRPSCYDCKFKGTRRQSDFTLADFWGIQNILPEMDDDNGTSLVLIHSDKGRKAFSAMNNSIVSQKVDADHALQYNPAAVSSVKKPVNRDLFMERIQSQPFDQAVNGLLPGKPSILKRLLQKAKRIILR